MDEGNYIGLSVYLVKARNVCVCYDTQLLRVKGWSQATIFSNKLSAKSEENKCLFFRERKGLMHMKYMPKELN